jgi:hypothetical protein
MKSILKNKNKKGAIGIIFFFILLFLILIAGFFLAMVWGVVDIASDEITPIMTGLGVVGDTNLSQASEYTFGVVDDFVQAIPWLIAMGYVMALIFSLVFVFIIGDNPHPAFIGFYLMLMILLIFGSIIMSNMYQDIYTGTDEIATRLQEQTITSYLILHSPFIMGIIVVIAGILMFARQGNNEGGGTGSFGI